VTRVLFVEGKDRAILATFARGLRVPWRLLSRPEQKLWLLESTGAGVEIERVAAVLPGVRAWAFDVVDEHPGD
jgi:hypothetical protein